ncbi:hypothetical protein BJF89_17070 [Corynebacterium sp. CNJ-954]|uniref:YdcF family protein n=1 Tax=Corynebacterium sp. CNJ-954 TaxID=1904962 RepID=UPI000964E192|nr:YdcF family protein [Corynebacterium sp. CNJ-954]OLT54285.1 hypothetical protein BJF89_17070 [Corynebacterium sp. CNJ-954]
MTAPPVVLAVIIALGIVLLGAGITGLIRDGRRIATPVYLAMGLGLTALGVGMAFANQGHPGPLIVIGLTVTVVFLLGILVGYPLLVVFLLYSGATVLRKESRSLGNALALIAGVGLLFLPTTLGMLAPAETVRTDPGYMARYATHLSATLVVLYFGFAFAAFTAASLFYRWRPIRKAPEAVIVLGAGLINGNVTPLLGARLDRGLAVQQQFHGTPAIIVSGGQGPDEPRPEGAAMRDYLIEQGADPATVIAETESRNTEENLRFSRQLLTDPSSPVVVATSSYHVFRAALLTRTLEMNAHAVGAPTAWYYFTSAVIREFVGVIRDRLWFTVLSIFVLIILAVAFTLVIVPAIGPEMN